MGSRRALAPEIIAEYVPPAIVEKEKMVFNAIASALLRGVNNDYYEGDCTDCKRHTKAHGLYAAVIRASQKCSVCSP